MALVVREIPSRLRRGVRRHGLLGALRYALVLHERPIWYELELDGERPRRALPEGVSLRRGEAADLTRLPGDMLRMRPAEAQALLAKAGTEIWLAEERGEPLFVCWLFHEATPAASAPMAWLELPDGVVCLEDSHVAEAARGRGLAPAAWCALADRLQQAGRRALITKVAESNTASRRAVEKAGFREVLRLDVRRIGPFWRARPLSPPQGPTAAALRERLER